MIKTHYEIHVDRVEKVETTRTEITVANAIRSELASTLTVECNPLLDYGTEDYSNVALSASLHKAVLTFRMKRLHLTCACEMIDGVLSPAFAKTGTVIPLVWTPPHNMGLTLMVTVAHQAGRGAHVQQTHLVAYDDLDRTWKLPVGNLYEDMKLCHGQAHMSKSTIMEAAAEAAELFIKSKWNSDLCSTDIQTRATKMFRFQPTNGGFDQMEMKLEEGQDWKALCWKVANLYVEQNGRSPL